MDTPKSANIVILRGRRGWDPCDPCYLLCVPVWCTPGSEDSPYVQDGFTQDFVQRAGLIGQGWPVVRLDVFWLNATAA